MDNQTKKRLWVLGVIIVITVVNFTIFVAKDQQKIKENEIIDNSTEIVGTFDLKVKVKENGDITITEVEDDGNMKENKDMTPEEIEEIYGQPQRYVTLRDNVRWYYENEEGKMTEYYNTFAGSEFFIYGFEGEYAFTFSGKDAMKVYMDKTNLQKVD